jgi:hypothetical protein
MASGTAGLSGRPRNYRSLDDLQHIAIWVTYVAGIAPGIVQAAKRSAISIHNGQQSLPSTGGPVGYIFQEWAGTAGVSTVSLRVQVSIGVWGMDSLGVSAWDAGLSEKNYV